jgi:hypothetical protein
MAAEAAIHDTEPRLGALAREYPSLGVLPATAA